MATLTLFGRPVEHYTAKIEALAASHVTASMQARGKARRRLLREARTLREHVAYLRTFAREV